MSLQNCRLEVVSRGDVFWHLPYVTVNQCLSPRCWDIDVLSKPGQDLDIPVSRNSVLGRLQFVHAAWCSQYYQHFYGYQHFFTEQNSIFWCSWSLRHSCRLSSLLLLSSSQPVLCVLSFHLEYLSEGPHYDLFWMWKSFTLPRVMQYWIGSPDSKQAAWWTAGNAVYAFQPTEFIHTMHYVVLLPQWTWQG